MPTQTDTATINSFDNKTNELTKKAYKPPFQGLQYQFEAYIIAFLLGGIAQLVERLHGMQEVIGSIPFTSTKNT